MYILVAVIQALAIIHALKTGRTQPWLYVLLFLPGIGVIAYILFEILPDPTAYPFGMQMHEFLHAKRQKKLSVETLEERANEKPTVENLVGLADAYGEKQQYEKAVELYRQAISRSIADDGEIRKKLAFALFEQKEYSRAKTELETISQIRQGRLRPDEQLYLARTLDALGDVKAATPHFERVAGNYPSVEGDYYYCQFLKKTGRESEIPRHVKETKKKYQEMARRFRGESSEWMKRVEREFR